MNRQEAVRTLTQTFRLPGASADDVARVLAEAPLVGPRSIFGDRTAAATRSAGDTRWIDGFEPVPVPLLRFDVEIRQQRTDDGIRLVLRFSQPRRKRPYLEGQFIWLLRDDDIGNAALLREEINTPTALGMVDQPLHGHRLSVRRALFFGGGHQRLMNDVVANIKTLLEADGTP